MKQYLHRFNLKSATTAAERDPDAREILQGVMCPN